MTYAVFHPNLASAKRQRFFGHLRATEVLPIHDLVNIAQAIDRFSPLMRSAALRQIVGKAPLEITHGRPYAESRRLCRVHFSI